MWSFYPSVVSFNSPWLTSLLSWHSECLDGNQRVVFCNVYNNGTSGYGKRHRYESAWSRKSQKSLIIFKIASYSLWKKNKKNKKKENEVCNVGSFNAIFFDGSIKNTWTYGELYNFWSKNQDRPRLSTSFVFFYILIIY